MVKCLLGSIGNHFGKENTMNSDQYENITNKCKSQMREKINAIHEKGIIDNMKIEGDFTLDSSKSTIPQFEKVTPSTMIKEPFIYDNLRGSFFNNQLYQIIILVLFILFLYYIVSNQNTM
jgi:hypothetical protein